MASAAAFGALGAVGLGAFRLPEKYYAIAAVFLPVSMICIAFKRKSMAREVYYLITLCMTAFLAGGFLTAVFGRIRFSNMTALAALFFLYVSGRLFIKELHREIREVDIMLLIHGEKVYLRAIVDTGNQLYEPVSQKPVMVAEKGCVGPYLQKKDLLAMRAVPFHSVGKHAGIFYAFPVQSLWIKQLGLHIPSVYVALYDGCIGDGRQALLHPDMLNG